MRRLLFAWFTLRVLMFATCAMAQEPARLALLIGNQSYGADVGPLKNPQNDVALMLIRLTTYAVALATLTRIGFGGMSRIADFVSLVPRCALRPRLVQTDVRLRVNRWGNRPAFC